MAVPPSPPKSNSHFFVISLASHNSNPIVPDTFFATHLEGKSELTNLKLTSDAYDITWQVKLNGRRFADGWENFSEAHSLRDDDVLLFRDDGDMIFHVTPSGRSFSQIHYISSSSNDYDDDSEDDHYVETWDKVSDFRNISPKKKSRLKTESSSSENSCILGVTSSNLRLNRVNLAKSFTIANGLHNSWCEIDLINQSGKSWVVRLRHNKGTCQDFIRGGWRSFCHDNELKTGCFYRFELVMTGTRPALKLCSDNTLQGNCSKAKVSAKTNREGERSRKKARVSGGEPSRRIQASHKSTVDPENLQCKQPLQTTSHQVKKSIANVLADLRRFRSELEIKEQNLEAVLEEIDVLGKKASEINKFFK